MSVKGSNTSNSLIMRWVLLAFGVAALVGVLLVLVVAGSIKSLFAHLEGEPVVIPNSKIEERIRDDTRAFTRGASTEDFKTTFNFSASDVEALSNALTLASRGERCSSDIKDIKKEQRGFTDGAQIRAIAEYFCTAGNYSMELLYRSRQVDDVKAFRLSFIKITLSHTEIVSKLGGLTEVVPLVSPRVQNSKVYESYSTYKAALAGDEFGASCRETQAPFYTAEINARFRENTAVEHDLQGWIATTVRCR